MEDTGQFARDLENASPAAIIYWAAKRFGGRLAITSSFQTQSLPLLHMVSMICPNVPVFFLDTGFHFEETYVYRDELVRRLGINVVNLQPLAGLEETREKYHDLYKSNPQMCCYMHKVEPLERALASCGAWISGIRRDQTKQRSNVKVVDHVDGRYKICPMVRVSHLDVDRYIEKYDLPRHPLYGDGFKSIGCKPCTQKVGVGDDYRSGRWPGLGKTECGLHLDNKNNKNKKEI